MKDGINGKVMKINNTLLVLKIIMEQAPISRSDLTRMVGLSQVSVINVTNVLLSAGVIVEVGRENRENQGRRSVVLDVNKDAFYSFGFELSVGRLACGLSDAKGNIIKFVETEFFPHEGADVLIDKVEEIVEDFLKQCQISRKSVLGVGFAVPGPLDVQNGMMINPPNFPGWRNVPIRKMLEERLGFRVCIDKETNLAALAESVYGVSANYKTSFFLSLFYLGVGGGLVSEKNIFHGFRDGAGEVGHMTVEPSGRKCSCGSYGCLEAMIAEDYILDRVRHSYKIGVEAEKPENIDDLTLADVFSRSGNGDKVCESVIKQMAAYISIAIGNIIDLFSPELIVLGGTVPELSDHLVELVTERVHSRKYPFHCQDVKIEKSVLGFQVYVRGAAVSAQRRFLQFALPEKF